MKLRNEFDVGVPVPSTWALLLDVPRVASALPGAAIEPDAEAGAFRGTMKIKLGPVTTEYTGSARMDDVDEDARVAGYRVEGQELRGQGSASATITARLSETGGGTHVVVETDLNDDRPPGAARARAHGGRRRRDPRRLRGPARTELRGETAPERAPAATTCSTSSAAVRGPVLARAGLVLAGLVAGSLLALGRAVWRR